MIPALKFETMGSRTLEVKVGDKTFMLMPTSETSNPAHKTRYTTWRFEHEGHLISIQVKVQDA